MNPIRASCWPIVVFAAATIGFPTLASAEDCALVGLGQRLMAREGGKFRDVDPDCTRARFSMPLTSGVEISELEGQIELTFDFDAPPPLGGPAHRRIVRAAVLATGRESANADWLVRSCVKKAAPLWAKDRIFEFDVPETATRLDRQRFLCGTRQWADKAEFQITFQFQDANYFPKDK